MPSLSAWVSVSLVTAAGQSHRDCGTLAILLAGPGRPHRLGLAGLTVLIIRRDLPACYMREAGAGSPMDDNAAFTHATASGSCQSRIRNRGHTGILRPSATAAPLQVSNGSTCCGRLRKNAPAQLDSPGPV